MVPIRISRRAVVDDCREGSINRVWTFRARANSFFRGARSFAFQHKGVAHSKANRRFPTRNDGKPKPLLLPSGIRVGARAHLTRLLLARAQSTRGGHQRRHHATAMILQQTADLVLQLRQHHPHLSTLLRRREERLQTRKEMFCFSHRRNQYDSSREPLAESSNSHLHFTEVRGTSHDGRKLLAQDRICSLVPWF